MASKPSNQLVSLLLKRILHLFQIVSKKEYFLKYNNIFTKKINIIVMSKGVVKFFNETKGFGFIIDTDSNKEYFVHVSGLIDKVKENDEVEFDLEEGRKGLNAMNVKLA